MGHLSLEDIYPEDVPTYGHMRVGMTERFAKESPAYDTDTLGKLRDLTSVLLRDEAVQMIISERLAALPEDYDPWIWAINRHRAIRLKNPDFDPWKD